MKLTKEDLEKAVFGKVRTIETEDGFVTFSRFSKEQERHLREDRGILRQPMGTAGMFLEVHGKVERIRFDYRYSQGSSRNFSGFTIMENGRARSCSVMNGNESSGSFEYFPFESGRLTLVFPGMYRMYLKNVEIDGTWEVRPRKRKIFIAGDSITQGYDAAETHRAYTNRLTEALEAECLNQAIGGDFFDPDNLDHLPDFKPDLIFIAYGTNDWSKEKDIVRTSEAYLGKLRKLFPEVRVFVIEPLWRATEGTVKEKTGFTVDDVRGIVRETALRHGFTVIPGLSLVPHDPNLFSDHSLHPNDRGFDFYSENLLNEIRLRAPELFE